MVYFILNLLSTGNYAWSIHKLKNLIQEQPKILAGDWSNLFLVIPPLSSFSNVLYINTL